MRSTRCRLLAVGAVCIVWGASASAAQAIDATSTTLGCNPTSPATGSPTSCQVTVTDIGASSPSAPAGAVTFSSAPNTGTFSGSGSCSLAADGAASASCTINFTPEAGGDYRVSAEYAGDSGHGASSAAANVSAIDPTSTALYCSPSRLSANTTTDCIATITDTHSRRAPVGEVTFSSQPTTGSFGDPGQCQWTPSGTGGTATCPVSFTPDAAGSYLLLASYSGDSVHAGSTGTMRVTATSSLSGGGPGSSNPNGLTLPVGPSKPGSANPRPGRIKIVGRAAKISRRHMVVVRLRCNGKRRAKCIGILTLTRKVKVRVKVRGRTRIETKVVKLGTVVYKLHGKATKSVLVILSKRGRSLLARSRRHRLKVIASAGGVVRTLVLRR